MLNLNIPEKLKEFYNPLTGSDATIAHLKAMGYLPGDGFWLTSDNGKDSDDESKGYSFYWATVLEDYNLLIRNAYKDKKNPGYRTFGKEIYTNGLGFIKNKSESSYDDLGKWCGNIFNYVQNFNNTSSETSKGFISRRCLVVESDVLTLQDQIDNISKIYDISGVLPNSIVFSGSKSLHAYYLLDNIGTEEEFSELFNIVNILINGDIAIGNEARSMRTPGTKRLTKTGWVDVSNIYARNGSTNFYGFYLSIKKYFETNFKEFNEDRFKLYKASRKAIADVKKAIAKLKANNEPFEHVVLDESKYLANPLEAFLLDEEFLLKKRFITEKAVGRDWDYKNDGSGKAPITRFWKEEVLPAFYNLDLDEQFSGNGFQANFNRGYQSPSPWSENNSSGTTLKLFPDKGNWVCWQSRNGGGDAIAFQHFLYFGKKELTNAEFKELVKIICTKVGLNFEEGIKKYRSISRVVSGDVNVKKSLEEAYEENVLDSYDFLSLDVSEVSKKTSTIRTPKTTLGMVLKNPEYATALQEVFQSDFINIKTPNVAVVKELQERGVTDVKVYVQPGDIQKSSMMMGYHQLAELLKDFNIKFEWHGQSEECHKFAHEIDTKLKFITFTHLCDKAVYLSNKKARSEAFNKISGCNDENVTEFCERYVSDAGIVMEAGKITLIDSPMGSGKTHFLELQVDEFLEENPEKAVISIGHRNGLQRAISRKCTLQMFIEDRGLNTNKLALAVDSVRHIPLNLFKGAFIILDEFEATIQHATTSSTISKRRKSCITRLKEGLQLCLASGGKVYASEANITDFTFEFLETIGIDRSQINFYKNNNKASERVILINAGNSDTATISDLLECVKSGKKILFATDSASKSEIVYEKLKKDNPDVKVILINKYTANDDLVKEFLENPDETIAREQPDCVIYSPTLDSGGDISKPYFDEVYGLFNTLETRVQLQMLFRCRVDIPIHIHVKETAKNDRDSNYTGFDVEELKALHKKGTEVFNKKSNSSNFYEGWLEEDDSLYELISRVNDDSTLEAKLLELFCKFEVRSNLAKADMRDNLISALSKTHFVEVQELGVVEGVKEELDIIKEEILEKRSEEFANADTSNMSVAAAEKILDSNSAKTEDVVKAEKKIFEENYPDIELSKGFAKKMLIKNNGEGRKKANELAIVMYPEMAKAKEKSSWESQKKSEMILLWDVKLVYQKSMLVNSLNFLEIVYKACDEGTFHKNNPDLINLAQEMAYKSKEFKRLYKVTINPKLSPVKVISGFCKKLGIKLEVVKRGVESDGSRTYIYNIVKDEDYDFTMQMVAAIKKNFDEKGIKEETFREREDAFVTPDFCSADIESSDNEDDFDFLDVSEQEIVREILESNFKANDDIPLDFYKIAFSMADETIKSNKELANLYG